MFVGAVTAYTVLILGQALAKNTETLLITRFLSAFFAASPRILAFAACTSYQDAGEFIWVVEMDSDLLSAECLAQQT